MAEQPHPSGASPVHEKLRTEKFRPLMNPDGTFNMRIVGRPRGGLGDLYHALMRAPWRHLLAAVVAVYVLANTAFALIYMAISDQITNLPPWEFWPAFFFSVQTLATIGYGVMAPAGLTANLVVTAEALVGLLGVAMVSGLMFARFSRPTARVVFSKVAVIAPFNGQRCLMFRVANSRANQITDAVVNITLTRDEKTTEGHHSRRMFDLRLLRNRSPMFALSWTVYHPIDAESPLFGLLEEDLSRGTPILMVTLNGVDDTFAQTVYARHAYSWRDIRWQHRFEDMIEVHEDGERYMHFHRIHDAKPIDDPG